MLAKGDFKTIARLLNFRAKCLIAPTPQARGRTVTSVRTELVIIQLSSFALFFFGFPSPSTCCRSLLTGIVPKVRGG